MNENIDLTKILEGCEGVKLYSPMHGECTLRGVYSDSDFPIKVKSNSGCMSFLANGKYDENGEIVLFPSEDQRDWSKFEKSVKFPECVAEAHDLLTEEESEAFDEEMRNLINLITARNAYWKLDGNWKPDWNKDSPKYGIRYNGEYVTHSFHTYQSALLVFRTDVIRNRFLENFMALIESCKEYLL